MAKGENSALIAEAMQRLAAITAGNKDAFTADNAVNYSKEGGDLFVTVDYRHENAATAATAQEMFDIMHRYKEFGCRYTPRRTMVDGVEVDKPQLIFRIPNEPKSVGTLAGTVKMTAVDKAKQLLEKSVADALKMVDSAVEGLPSAEAKMAEARTALQVHATTLLRTAQQSAGRQWTTR